MNASVILATQRRLLDDLYTSGRIRYLDYLNARQQLADAPIVTCYRHSNRPALIYTDGTPALPLCGECALTYLTKASAP